MTLRAVLDEAVAAGAAPGLVGAVLDRDGLRFIGAAGRLGAEPEAGPMREDAVFRLFSMTKAVASVAAAQLWQAGRLDLDAPVTALVPAFARVRRLTGWEGDAPVWAVPERAPTVAELMTHQAGLPYEYWNADALRASLAQGRRPSAPADLDALCAFAMIRAPGQGFDYGVATDWLGLVIEAASGQSLDAWCRDRIFAPLGMSDTAFCGEGYDPARLTRPAARGEAGFAPSRIAPPASPGFHGMGHALWSSTADYARFLRMLLRGGEDVLAAETVAALFDSARGPAMPAMRSVMAPASADVTLFEGLDARHGLAFALTGRDAFGARRAGSGGWAGILNTHFWVDPKAGLAGLFMAQTLPFCDPALMRGFAAFERAAYEAVA